MEGLDSIDLDSDCSALQPDRVKRTAVAAAIARRPESFLLMCTTHHVSVKLHLF